jgi:hypothetical protein
MRVRRYGAVKSAVWFAVAAWAVLAGGHDIAYAQAGGDGSAALKGGDHY